MTRNATAPLTVLLLLLLPLLGGAQASDTQALALAQRTFANELRQGLPSLPLADWLRAAAGPAAAINWEMDDCGEQTGDPALDRDRDLPICASARIALAGDHVVTLSFLVGSARQGIGGRPALYYGQFDEPDQRSFEIRDLTTVPGFMSEDARVALANQWVSAIHVGMRRDDVERLLGRPPGDGGLARIGDRRYYLGWRVKITVPYRPGQLLRPQPDDTVTGPAVVSRGGYTLD